MLASYPVDSSMTVWRSFSHLEFMGSRCRSMKCSQSECSNSLPNFEYSCAIIMNRQLNCWLSNCPPEYSHDNTGLMTIRCSWLNIKIYVHIIHGYSRDFGYLFNWWYHWKILYSLMHQRHVLNLARDFFVFCPSERSSNAKKIFLVITSSLLNVKCRSNTFKTFQIRISMHTFNIQSIKYTQFTYWSLLISCSYIQSENSSPKLGFSLKPKDWCPKGN